MELTITSFIQTARRPIVQKILSAMFTQGLLSVSNFAIGLAIAKYAPKSEYAMFVILFSIIGIVGNYQNALINTPLAVLFHKKESTEKALFLSGLGFGQWLLFFPVAILTVIVTATYSFIYQEFSILKYVMILSVATLAYLLREFVRSVNYSKMRIDLIIKMDVLFICCVATGLWLLISFQSVTSIYSITVLGVGYFLSAVFEYFLARDVYILDWQSIKKAFAETWQYSSWSLISVSSYMLQNRGYIYIISAMLGLSELADISAAKLFLMPLGLAIQSSNKIILAKGGEVLNVGHNGIKRFRKFILSMTCFLVLICIMYLLLLWSSHKLLITYVLGEKYSNIEGVILLWGIFFFVETLRFPVNRALMACKEFKVLANYDILSAIITTAACFILTGVLSGSGAIIALIVGELTLLLFNIFRLTLFFKQNSLN